LLDVLSGRVSLKSCETNRGSSQNGGTEIEVTGNDACSRNEVIALLRFRKDIGNIVALVAPGIHIYRCKEYSKGRVQHDSVLMHVVRHADAGRKPEFVRVA